MFEKLAVALERTFATNQNSHFLQQPDGSYRRKTGIVSVRRILEMLTRRQSIAVVQKNVDATVNWICFDFDIPKSVLEAGNGTLANVELNRCVHAFCVDLESIGLRYLLEYSGNRGFHVWIVMKEPIKYGEAFQVHQEILRRCTYDFNGSAIVIDLFPKSPTPTTGTGNGVKLPCSLHSKSGNYSLLISDKNNLTDDHRAAVLDEKSTERTLEILDRYEKVSRQDLEEKLHLSLDEFDDEGMLSNRIRRILSAGFSVDQLLTHWTQSKPLAKIAAGVVNDLHLTNSERKLVVGILRSVETQDKRAKFAYRILIELFSRTKNFSKERTEKALTQLSSFAFPSQEQIETAVGVKFEATLSIAELVQACIPNFQTYELATFDLCHRDVEVTRIAELNYLFANDEAQSRLVISELSGGETEELFIAVNELISSPELLKFYRHERQEIGKVRNLITMGSVGRVATTAVLKQIVEFLTLTPSPYTFGYRINSGFSKGQIFQPWLYKWIEFTSNIEAAISDPDYYASFIVKTDIRSFYDELPHDGMKRLLLSDGDRNIQHRLEALSAEDRAKYNDSVDFLFKINKQVVEGAIRGVPQGPAYARWFAELYLASLDEIFEPLVSGGKVQLYQRYVDDIFFIVPTEDLAEKYLSQAKDHLLNLGLELNLEKTTIKQIGAFGEDFEKYRSQSKYAVDRASRNFSDATDAEKNNAIVEFLKLIESQACNDDLAFIYSHLAGVEPFDKWKRDRAIPIIASGIGRGSLFKHLFNFLVENEDNWTQLEKAEEFTSLQSEVLTSSILEFILENENRSISLCSLVDKVIPKLRRTTLVDEHVALILLQLGDSSHLRGVEARQVIQCLASSSALEAHQVTDELLAYINTELNAVGSFRDLVKILFVLCSSETITKQGINNLAPVFFAKLSSDHRRGGSSADREVVDIWTPVLLSKYHFLTCLYSVSKLNRSDDLVREAWRLCILASNVVGGINASRHTGNWLRKVDDIEVDPSKVMLLLSAILDGNFIRGVTDENQIFGRYHSALLVYFALNTKDVNIYSMQEMLAELSEKALFYKWLLEKNEVNFFPSSREWFERNLLRNDLIMLRRGGQVLIRRAVDKFVSGASLQNVHKGYAELLLEYDPRESISVSEALDTRSARKKLTLLSEHLILCKEKVGFPNIFSADRLLKQDALSPVSTELSSCDYLVYQPAPGLSIDALESNAGNFLACFFGSDRLPLDRSFGRLYERYIKNLGDEIDPASFIGRLDSILPIEMVELDDFLLDVSSAAAVYSALEGSQEGIVRLESFVRFYHRFDGDGRNRHMYALDEATNLCDTTPDALLDSVCYSLALVREKVNPALPIFLDSDLLAYKKSLESALGGLLAGLSLNSFVRANVSAKPLSGVVNIGAIADVGFEKITLVFGDAQVETASLQHVPKINSAQHTFVHMIDERAIVLLMPAPVSKIYASLLVRLEKIFEGKAARSFPHAMMAADEESLRGLANYAGAVQVIAEHRDIGQIEAGATLTRWLQYLPSVVRQPLVTLISAHVVMTKEDVSAFCQAVRTHIDSRRMFCIKRLEDMGGTQRILVSDSTVNRRLDSLSPLGLAEGLVHATIVVDIVISGGQMMSAFKHYLCEGSEQPGMHFAMSTEQRMKLQEKLRGLKRLSICCVLYTRKGVDRIKSELRELISPMLDIDIVCGRDVGDDAWFESSRQIGEADKARIRSLLGDSVAMEGLRSHFIRRPSGRQIKAMSVSEINSSNLVARYQSLPKRSFWFLRTGLRADNGCHPLIRIGEANEV